MAEHKKNWKLIIKIHQVLVIIALVMLFVLKNEYRNFVLILAGTVVFSLIIQIFIYVVRPGLYSDKNRGYPDEDYS